MDIIKTGIGISRTIKNVARLREIVGVFAKNGFDEFIIQTKLHEKIPKFVFSKKRIEDVLREIKEQEGDDWAKTIGRRLRKSFEELGPSFIKLGQLLASRQDLFDPNFIAQMKLLQNEVAGIDFSQLRSDVEKSLGHKIDDIFDNVEEKPIGTASVAVVYRAKLKSGEDVVIKVRRPHIVEKIDTDISTCLVLAHQVEKVSDEIKLLGISRVIEDFAKNIQLELDFRMEALNCAKLGDELQATENETPFYIPKMYSDYVRDDLLVMEYLDGTPFNQLTLAGEEKKEIHAKFLLGARYFISSLLSKGFFHADLHGGNFFLLKNGNIGIIDFGLMGNLSPKGRINLVSILYSLVTNNYENMVLDFLDVVEYDQIPDQDVLVRDMRDALAPYIGLTVQQTDLPKLVNALTRTLGKHRLYLPREWYVIFRALITIDGVGRSVGFDVNIFEIIEEDIHGIITDVFSKKMVMEESIWLGRDILNSMRILPKHIRWFFKEWSKNNYTSKMNIVGMEEASKNFANSIQFLGFSVITAVLIYCAVLLLDGQTVANWREIPLFSWGFGALAVFVFTLGISKIRK